LSQAFANTTFLTMQQFRSLRNYYAMIAVIKAFAPKGESPGTSKSDLA
jgi:hypothetical protein